MYGIVLNLQLDLGLAGNEARGKRAETNVSLFKRTYSYVYVAWQAPDSTPNVDA